METGLFTVGGVVIGSLLTYFLTRRWQREQWRNDNRKEEFRELIGAITASAIAFMKQTPYLDDRIAGREKEERYTLYLEALRVIKTRIFIARDVKEMNLNDRWVESINGMGETDTIDQFEERFEKIRDEIIERATK